MGGHRSLEPTTKIRVEVKGTCMTITLKFPMISLPEVDPEIIKKGRWGEGWLLLINGWPYHNNAVVLLMLDFLFYDNTTYQYSIPCSSSWHDICKTQLT